MSTKHAPNALSRNRHGNNMNMIAVNSSTATLTTCRGESTTGILARRRRRAAKTAVHASHPVAAPHAPSPTVKSGRTAQTSRASSANASGDLLRLYLTDVGSTSLLNESDELSAAHLGPGPLQLSKIAAQLRFRAAWRDGNPRENSIRQAATGSDTQLVGRGPHETQGAGTTAAPLPDRATKRSWIATAETFGTR